MQGSNIYCVISREDHSLEKKQNKIASLTVTTVSVGEWVSNFRFLPGKIDYGLDHAIALLGAAVAVHSKTTHQKLVCALSEGEGRQKWSPRITH